MKDKREIVMIDQTYIDANQDKFFNKNKKSNKIFTIFLVALLFVVGFFCSLFYGPWRGFRDLWITSAMKTKSHQYLAKIFYSDKVIYEVLYYNNVAESEEISDPSLIQIDKRAKKRIKNSFLEWNGKDLYKLLKIEGDTYNGYLVAIYDPSKVELAVSKYLGKFGESIKTIAKDNHAIVTINAAGYYDPGWSSNGEVPHGVVIQNGKVISEYDAAGVGGGFVGFTEENKLILAKVDKEEALRLGYRDAVEFGPFLIVNGKKSTINGNGGWGIAPRTAIGQRADGIVLFLVINGRLTTSIGADMNDLAEIMKNYGAVNACNMDGGSSSELLIKNKIINRPVGNGVDGLRNMPTFWILKES